MYFTKKEQTFYLENNTETTECHMGTVHLTSDDKHFAVLSIDLASLLAIKQTQFRLSASWLARGCCLLL